jgi:pentapeptide repeat protein/DUF2934 family protein
MENLTAFVRERSRRNEAERTSQNLEERVRRRAYFLWLEAGRPEGRAEDFWARAIKQEEFGEPAADIAAALTVINRRSEQSRERESANGWRFGLNGAVLSRADLRGAHLERADLTGARFEGANLRGAHLERADLRLAHLEGAVLYDAHLEGANLLGAYLERAVLVDAHLEGADLSFAHLERAVLVDAHLGGADLSYARLEGANLVDAHLEGGADLSNAHGDAGTKLPEGMARPAHWPASAPESPH